MMPPPANPSAPKVSFVALCFNHAPYLVECLDSIEAQAWPNAELVILDNASSDGSADRIREWAATSSLDPKLLLQSEPRGICANVNTLIRHATGDYIGLIATDDYWLPQKTAGQVAALERLGPDFAVTYADALQIDASGEPLEPASFIQAHRELAILPSGDIFLDLLQGPFIPAMSTLIRRSALDAMGPFDESLVYEDYDAWLRLAEHWKFHADPTPLCAYRILASSMIRTVAAQDKPEKILSDARIMAKVTAVARLDEKTRKSIRRRVLKLVLKLLCHPGDWHDDLIGLQGMTGLRSLLLLAAAHRHRGPIAEEASTHLLTSAAQRGYLFPDEVAALSKAVSSQLKALKDRAPEMESGARPVESQDLVRWQEVYQSLETEDRPSEQSSQRKSRWGRSKDR